MELQKIVKSQVDRARFGCKISTVIPGYIRPGKAVRLPTEMSGIQRCNVFHTRSIEKVCHGAQDNG